MNKVLLVLLFPAILLSASCKRQQVFSDNSGQKCVAKEAQFKYLSIKAKVKVDSEDLNQNFTLNLRIKKDEIIWLSASYIIEGIRCYITPDSIRVIDRLKKTYYTYSFNDLSRQFNTKLDFQLLQSLLLGTLPKVKDSEYTITAGEQECLLKFKNSIFILDNYIRNDINKLSKLVLTENRTSNVMVMTYDDFKADGKNIFPFHISSSITENNGGVKKTSNIEMEYKKIKTSKTSIEFPFTVSDRYEEK